MEYYEKVLIGHFKMNGDFYFPWVRIDKNRSIAFHFSLLQKSF